MTRTFGTLIGEARTLLQDKLPTTGGALRYTDDEMFECINAMLTEVRTKRPDSVPAVRAAQAAAVL